MTHTTATNRRDDSEDIPSELPPLDQLDDDDVPLDDLEQTWIAMERPVSGDPVLDEAAIDLDVGIRIDEPQADSDDSQGAIAMDLAALINIDDADAGDEVDGPGGLDPALGIEEPPPVAEDGAAEGVDEATDYLVADRLPGLDADEEGLFDVDPTWSLDQGARDEPPPLWSDPLWSVLAISTHEVHIAPSSTQRPSGLGEVLCVTPRPPLVAVVRQEGRLALARAVTQETFDIQPLDDEAHRIADGDHPIVAADGKFVALGDDTQGIVVSLDGGKNFEAVAGCAGVTALALAHSRERPLLLAAIHRESQDVSELVCVDLTRLAPQRVATLRATRPDDSARVRLLVWDSETDELLATGEFGDARIVPPRQ